MPVTIRSLLSNSVRLRGRSWVLLGILIVCSGCARNVLSLDGLEKTLSGGNDAAAVSACDRYFRSGISPGGDHLREDADRKRCTEVFARWFVALPENLDPATVTYISKMAWLKRTE